MRVAAGPRPASGRWLQVLTLLLVLLSCSWSEPGLAQDGSASVRLDGRVVLQVGPTEEGESADERAARIESRLASLLPNVAQLGPAIPKRSGNSWTVTVSGIPIVTVTPRDAEDNLVSEDVLARQWASRLNIALQRARERRAGLGGRFGAEIAASAEAAFGRLSESAVRVIPRAIAAILVIVLFWTLAKLVRWVLSFIFRRSIEDLTVESLIKQLTYYAILALGFFVALDALGFTPTTVAAGIGLTGVVLGFALRDVLSNFVSGLLLLMLRPFEIGDQIVIGELEGNVERIELRATRLRAYDGRVMLVPNAEVFTARIINNTADPLRRGKVQARLGYDSDLRKAADAARMAAKGAKGVLDAPGPMVRIDELDRDDIVLEVTFWTDSRRSDYKNTASAVRAAIIDAFKQASIGLPNPDVRLLAPRDGKEWAALLSDAKPRSR